MKVDFQIRCKALVPMAEGMNDCYKDAAILIKGSRIYWSGEYAKLPVGIEADTVIDFPDFIAMPGLVNTHTHAAMVLLRGFGDDLALQEWLTTKVFPAEAGLTADDVYWGTLLASIEMVKSGCTAFADMYFYMDSAAEAVADSGLRAALARSVSSITDPDFAKLQESLDFCKRWDGVADGRITALMSPHSLYTCSPEYAAKLAAIAKDNGLGIHTHLAETRREEKYAIETFGKSTAAKMMEVGLFDIKALAAHCVWLSDEDMDILAEKDVKVAHNPGSNTKLASGIARVAEMQKRGITVGLGTDGASSNNNLDMMEEIRLATLLAKVSSLDPTALPAKQVLRMATADGAKCLLSDGSFGALSAGMKADIAFVDTRGEHMVPEHDAISNIVYSARGSDIDTVFIDGKMVLASRKMLTIDENEVKRQCAERAARLVSGLS